MWGGGPRAEGAGTASGKSGAGWWRGNGQRTESSQTEACVVNKTFTFSIKLSFHSHPEPCLSEAFLFIY